jgi:hypothetical protein
MASRDLKLHVVTVGNSKIGIKEPDKYGGIADIVGVKLAVDSDKITDSATISEAKKGGKLITLAAIDKDGKSHRIQCSIDKASSAISGLVGKSFAGKTIASAGIPRRRSRR